jgi:hypothetical protein
MHVSRFPAASRVGGDRIRREYAMDDFSVFLILCGTLLVAIGVLFSSQGYEHRRREALQALATKLGLRYQAGRDYNLLWQYGFLNQLRQGRNRYGFNILKGVYDDQPVMVFDFHYETFEYGWRGWETKKHYNSFFILFLDRQFPELRIYPETLLSKFEDLVGLEDIDFESVEFSKAFTVRSKDKKFAYDICHTRMMEYLLRYRRASIEIEQNCLATCDSQRLGPEDIEMRLKQLIEIRQLFPRYLLDRR